MGGLECGGRVGVEAWWKQVASQVPDTVLHANERNFSGGKSKRVSDIAKRIAKRPIIAMAVGVGEREGAGLYKAGDQLWLCDAGMSARQNRRREQGQVASCFFVCGSLLYFL